MAAKRRPGGGRARASAKAAVPENAIARYEPEFQGSAVLGDDRMTARLRRALEAADGSVQRASALGKYELSTITLTCSLKAGFVVLDMSGALALTWTRPRG